MQFNAANDTAAVRFAHQNGLDFAPVPQALIALGGDDYEVRRLRGAFGGYLEWYDGDDYEALPEDNGDLTEALARFASVAPDERLVRIF